MRVDVNVEGSHRGLRLVGTDSLAGVGFPEIDFVFSGAGEEEIAVVVEANDGDWTLVAFEDEWAHAVDSNRFDIIGMNRDETSEQDVRINKVKEGFLTKRSRFLKDWKKRWMVLTKTHLYAFELQGVYKAPTEKIALKEVTTIKSFYKNQYERPQVFRVESDDSYFYLSAQDHQEKWSWVTAIERMTERIRNPSMQDSQNLIRESIKMSSAARQSGAHRKSIANQNSNDINNDLFKRLKLKLQSHVGEVQAILKGPPSRSSNKSQLP